MSTDFESWKDQLINLPHHERAELAYVLLSSLEPEDDNVEAAWDEEAGRRVDEIHSGKATGVPAEDLIAELRERYP